MVIGKRYSGDWSRCDGDPVVAPPPANRTPEQRAADKKSANRREDWFRTHPGQLVPPPDVRF